MGEWYVISLRPLGQHGGVRRSAAAHGARTFALSTLRLQALPAMPALRAALRCPDVLVTSPAAARFAHAQLPLSARRGQRWFALGAGSARALHRCGIAQVRVPDSGSDSEALLALAELQAVSGRRIGVLTAPGGRGLIADELIARGAQLHVAAVYRRQPRVPTPARQRALQALPATTALLLTSHEAFQVLWQELDAPARRQLLRRPCLVASPRLAARARALGFACVLQASDARPGQLLACLAAHVAARRFR